MDKLVKYCLPLLTLVVLSCGQEKRHPSSGESQDIDDPPSLEQRFAKHQEAYNADPTADNLIWLGRFTAYLGRYTEAIKLYTQGVTKYPDDARFLRHRGHRYISLRKFAEAIADLEKAADMTSGHPDQVEPDGMPNPKNIPVSTLQTNIWYHLGLAHYLQQDFASAEAAYQTCRQIGTNDDNWVSASHWLFSSAARMGNIDLAKDYVAEVDDSMQVIENHSYLNLCLFYQGNLTEDALTEQTTTAGSASDAILYGLGNWHNHLGDPIRGKSIFQQILQGEGKASFGYIAAESDLNR